MIVSFGKILSFEVSRLPENTSAGPNSIEDNLQKFYFTNKPTCMDLLQLETIARNSCYTNN